MRRRGPKRRLRTGATMVEYAIVLTIATFLMLGTIVAAIGVFYYQYYDGAGFRHQERYLVDADGTALYLGNWTDPPSLPSYFKASLNSSATVLTNALEACRRKGYRLGG